LVHIRHQGRVRPYRVPDGGHAHLIGGRLGRSDPDLDGCEPVVEPATSLAREILDWVTDPKSV
jgi:hypothetical protein